MNLKETNMVLDRILEQVAGDENDPDVFGLDPAARKRLKVKNKFSKMKNKPVKPMPSFLPYSLVNF